MLRASRLRVEKGEPVVLHGIPMSTRPENWRLRIRPDTHKDWVYLRTDEECESWPQSNMEKFVLGMPMDDMELRKNSTPMEAATHAYEFLKKIQAPDGHWPGLCGGQMYLGPMYIISLYLCGKRVQPEEAVEMARFMINSADHDDGGWGLHGEHPTTVFGITINYIALRILGLSPDHPTMVKARSTLHANGGAVCCPAWGKFWLAMLNLYDWTGNNPIPPETWLLPEWTPIHPSKWWIFMRAFYIPMSYLYRVRFQIPEDPLILVLRKELFIQDWDTIHWPSQRNNIAKIDYLVPHSTFLDAFYFLATNTYEACPFPPLTRYAVSSIYEQVLMEDDNTDYYDLISVSNYLQMLCRAHAEGTDSEAVRRHMFAIKEFLWLAADGMQGTATNGCQVWDISFISHALIYSGLAERPENQESIRRLLRFLDGEQMQTNTMHFPKDYRQRNQGGWPFSTRRQNGYVVSDTTGEALKAICIMQNRLKEEERVSDRRLFDTVDLLISMQSSDGGLPSYENKRGNKLLEALNPAELYDKMMVEYSYPECTTSVINGLHEFSKRYAYRAQDIDNTIKRAIQYLHNSQYPDGGWLGSWGICFTYGTWFALNGLCTFGETYANSQYVRKACHFLLKYQRADGGWGESWRSCHMCEYVEAEETNMAQTCWATMALMLAKYPDKAPVERAVKKVMGAQLPDGSWTAEAATGIGIRTGVILYPLYRITFPIWMLGMADRYLKGEKA